MGNIYKLIVIISEEAPKPYLFDTEILNAEYSLMTYSSNSITFLKGIFTIKPRSADT